MSTGFMVSTIVCKFNNRGMSLVALTIILGLYQGYGVHYELLGPSFVTHFFKNLFVGEILYTLTLCFAKFSILAFCWRLFGSTVSIRLPIYILGSLVTLWSIAVVGLISMTVRQAR